MSTARQTNRRTDKASYRVACPKLKDKVILFMAFEQADILESQTLADEKLLKVRIYHNPAVKFSNWP